MTSQISEVVFTAVPKSLLLAVGQNVSLLQELPVRTTAERLVENIPSRWRKVHSHVHMYKGLPCSGHPFLSLFPVCITGGTAGASPEARCRQSIWSLPQERDKQDGHVPPQDTLQPAGTSITSQ